MLKKYTLYLSELQVDALKRIAQSKSVSYSAIIRIIISDYIKKENKNA